MIEVVKQPLRHFRHEICDACGCSYYNDVDSRTLILDGRANNAPRTLISLCGDCVKSIHDKIGEDLEKR